MLSIYYQANRDYLLTEAEQKEVSQILMESATGYPFSEMGETLCQYDYDPAEPSCVLAGSVKLPYSDEIEDYELMDMQVEAVFYFLPWLTKLRRAVPDAHWVASFEGDEMIWEEEYGWRMMTNEEYKASLEN